MHATRVCRPLTEGLQMNRNEHKKAAEEHLSKASKRGGDHAYHLKAAELHTKLATVADDEQAEK